MKKVLFIFLPLSLFFNANIFSQSFSLYPDDTIPVVVNGVSLNNAWAGGINFPMFSEIDLNGDGIHDLFMYERDNGRILTFINDGSQGTHAWHYAPHYVSSFPPINQWALLYDYNCDGKQDLFTLSPGQSGIAVYRNDFDPINGLHFTLVTSQLNELYFSLTTNVYASSVQIPAFGDIDNDGDMDILGFNSWPDGRVLYHRNYSVEQGYSCDSLIFKLEDQHWGNFMVAATGGNAHIGCFHCRPGHSGTDDTLEENIQREAAPRDDTFFSIFMIDVDGDGDKDLLIGDGGATNSLLVVNGGTPDSASMTGQDTIFPTYNVPATMCNLHFHAYIDVDNDGVKDLLVESGEPGGQENIHGILFYKNTGTNNTPLFAYQTSSFLADQMIDVGEGSSPVLFDADGDGLKDLVIGNFGVFDCNSGSYPNSLYLFRNTGTASAPSFQLTDTDYAGMSALGRTGPLYPTFGDLDNDGDLDMIIGEYDGKLWYFNNSGGSGAANFHLAAANFMSIDVGNSSTPQLIDLNRDGKLDLVIGEKNGFLNYYQNSGTASAPFFSSVPTIDTLGGINLQTPGYIDGYTVPYFYNDQGQYKLLVSCMKGDVYLYNNIDGNLSGNFNLIDTILSGSAGIRYEYNLGVSGGDLNNDGLTDMLLGIYSGGMQIYMGIPPGNNAPLNDSICHATALTLNGITAYGNNLHASVTEPPVDSLVTALGYTCSLPNNTVWYSYTAATNDSFFVDYSANSGFNGKLGVFTSNNSGTPCLGTLSYVNCLNGPLSLGTPATVELHFAGIAGTTYLFMIDGVAGSVGPYSIRISSSSTINVIQYPDQVTSTFELFPNPAGEECVIRLENMVDSNNNQLNIMNDLGQIIFSKIRLAENNVINTHQFAAGVYTVQLISKSTSVSKKLVIQH